MDVAKKVRTSTDILNKYLGLESIGIKGDEPTFVYFAQDNTIGAIKIGFTAQLPKQRLAALKNQKEVRANTTMLAAALGTRSTEKLLHKKFAKNRIKGEWFAATSELMTLVDSLRPYFWEDGKPARAKPRIKGARIFAPERMATR